MHVRYSHISLLVLNTSVSIVLLSWLINFMSVRYARHIVVSGDLNAMTMRTTYLLSFVLFLVLTENETYGWKATQKSNQWLFRANASPRAEESRQKCKYFWIFIKWIFYCINM